MAIETNDFAYDPVSNVLTITQSGQKYQTPVPAIWLQCALSDARSAYTKHKNGFLTVCVGAGKAKITITQPSGAMPSVTLGRQSLPSVVAQLEQITKFRRNGGMTDEGLKTN